MRGHSAKDLKRLEDALLALPEDSDPMLLSEFDGYCAGLLVCPELVPPSQWLAEVWGNAPPSFETVEDMQVTLDLVMAHYNRVAAMLVPPAHYGPVFEEEVQSGDLLWELWMLGFSKAMRLRPQAWMRVTRGDDSAAVAALSRAMELMRFAHHFEQGGERPKGALAKDAADIIPEIVLELNRFTKAQALEDRLSRPFASNWPIAPVTAPRPGRNDPCPCGSGKKYKKCCGLN